MMEFLIRLRLWLYLHGLLSTLIFTTSCCDMYVKWSIKCSWDKCKKCAQCNEKPPCAASCHTREEPWWPDNYPNHESLYPTSGYKCTSVAECLGCPACTGKPNIVFILADDIGFGDLDSPKLPPLKNINSLKSNGMWFSDTHTSPLCAPSRYIVLSGRLSFRGRQRSGTTITATCIHSLNIDLAMDFINVGSQWFLIMLTLHFVLLLLRLKYNVKQTF